MSDVLDDATGGGSAVTTEAPDLPLAGTRIIDLTMVWAGPFATLHLADLGAEIIKIEGPARPDASRAWQIPDKTVDSPWNHARYFRAYNRDKLSLTVDLRNPDGQAIIHDLARSSDVLIENFRPGVIDRLGISYKVLKEINPRIIVVSIPGYSSVEPERRVPGYGPNVEQMSGLAHLNGYRDGPPQKSGISYGDPIGGWAAVSAVLLALVQRERTGVGQYIEVGQRNALVEMIGDAVIASQFHREPARQGNRSPVVAPQGVYPCLRDEDAGEADAWLALSVVDDDQWLALCRGMDRDDLANRYGDIMSRQMAHDLIDEEIERWTRTVDVREAADRLQAVGVPASPVLTAAGLRDDPHLVSRGFLRTVEHPVVGDMTLNAPTWHFRDVDRELVAAPDFGQHNHVVLRELLHYDDDKVKALYDTGVVAERPLTW